MNFSFTDSRLTYPCLSARAKLLRVDERDELLQIGKKLEYFIPNSPPSVAEVAARIVPPEVRPQRSLGVDTGVLVHLNPRTTLRLTNKGSGMSSPVLTAGQREVAIHALVSRPQLLTD